MIKSKKGITSTLPILVVIVIFAVAVLSIFGPRTHGAMKTVTNTANLPGSELEELNKRNWIKQAIERQDYNEAIDEANYFIQQVKYGKYSNKQYAMEVYYMKLYVLLKLARFNEARDLIIDYMENYPDEFENSPRHQPSRALFNYVKDLSENRKQDALGKMQNMFEFSNHDYLIHVPEGIHQFGNLVWPGLGEDVNDGDAAEITYPVVVNPYFFNLFWYTKSHAQMNTEQNPSENPCNDDFIGMIFSELLYAEIENKGDNKEAFRRAYREIKDICGDMFDQVSYNHLKSLLSVIEGYNYYSDGETMKIEFRQYSQLGDNSLFAMNYIYLMRELVLIDELMLDQQGISNDAAYHVLWVLDDIQKDAKNGLKDGPTEYSAFAIFNRFIEGFLNAAAGTRHVKKSCEFDWEIRSIFRDQIAHNAKRLNSKYPRDFDPRCLRDSMHFFKKAKHAYRELFGILSKPESTIIIDYFTQDTRATRALTEEEKEQLLLNVIPYYLQATYLVDIYENDFDYSATERAVESVVALFCEKDFPYPRGSKPTDIWVVNCERDGSVIQHAPFKPVLDNSLSSFNKMMNTVEFDYLMPVSPNPYQDFDYDINSMENLKFLPDLGGLVQDGLGKYPLENLLRGYNVETLDYRIWKQENPQKDEELSFKNCCPGYTEWIATGAEG